MEGLEPTRLAALEPKSSASANFATSAKARYQISSLDETDTRQKTKQTLKKRIWGAFAN